jgi:hypothetical protein
VDAVSEKLPALTDLERLVEATKLLGSMQLAWTVKRFGEYRDGLMTHSPFQPGDRVRLTIPPQITHQQSWGWMAHKHYLIKGAIGTVREIDWSGGSDGHFRCAVEFDDESWLNKGLPQPIAPENRGRFWMEARRFEKARVLETQLQGQAGDDPDGRRFAR